MICFSSSFLFLRIYFLLFLFFGLRFGFHYFVTYKSLFKDVPSSEPSSPDSVHNLIDLKKEESTPPRPPPIVEAVNSECKSSHPFQKCLTLPNTSNYPLLIKSPSKIHVSSSLQSFDSRTVKHHSFDSDLDVKYMEKNLISLLDDFHNGKHQLNLLNLQGQIFIQIYRKAQSIFRKFNESNEKHS